MSRYFWHVMSICLAPFVEKDYLFPIEFLWLLCSKTVDYICESISQLCIMFHWFICLFSCKYHTILITIATQIFKYVLISSSYSNSQNILGKNLYWFFFWDNLLANFKNIKMKSNNGKMTINSKIFQKLCHHLWDLKIDQVNPLCHRIIFQWNNFTTPVIIFKKQVNLSEG